MRGGGTTHLSNATVTHFLPLADAITTGGIPHDHDGLVGEAAVEGERAEAFVEIVIAALAPHGWLVGPRDGSHDALRLAVSTVAARRFGEEDHHSSSAPHTSPTLWPTIVMTHVENVPQLVGSCCGHTVCGAAPVLREARRLSS